MKWLLELRGRLLSEPSPDPGASPITPLDEEIPRYPPFMRGLPATDVDSLMQTQEELIRRLRQALPVDDDDFERFYLPALRRYAEHVHLLPASEAHHHRGAGGLFRHGLEVALYAAEKAGTKMFGLDVEPANRRQIQLRWYYAIVVASLAHDIGKPVTDLSVTSMDGASTWSPATQPLLEWAREHGVNRYFLHWREGRRGRHDSVSVLMLQRLVDREGMDYLSKPQPEILSSMTDAIRGEQNIIGELVRFADSASVEMDLRHSRQLGDSELGVPVERYIIDAMRRLISSRQWKVNTPGGLVWFMEDSLFLVWPRAAEEVIACVDADKLPGIPRAESTLADILFDRDIAIPAEGGRLWILEPDVLNEGRRGVRLRAIRLTDPTLLIDPPPAATGGKVYDSPPRQKEGSEKEPGSEDRVGEQSQSEAQPLQEPAPQPAAESPEKQRKDGTNADASSASNSGTDSPPAAETAEVESEPSHSTSAEHEATSDDHAAGPDSEPINAPSQASEQTPLQRLKGGVRDVLVALLEDVQKGERPRDVLVKTAEGVFLRWPKAITGYGHEPKELLAELDAAGCVVPHPTAPMRKVQKIFSAGEPVQGLQLEQSLSEWILAHWPEPESEPETGPDSVPAEETAPPQTGAKPKPGRGAPAQKTAQAKGKQTEAKRRSGTATTRTHEPKEVVQALFHAVSRSKKRDARIQWGEEQGEVHVFIPEEYVARWLVRNRYVRASETQGWIDKQASQGLLDKGKLKGSPYVRLKKPAESDVTSGQGGEAEANE